MKEMQKIVRKTRKTMFCPSMGLKTFAFLLRVHCLLSPLPTPFCQARYFDILTVDDIRYFYIARPPLQRCRAGRRKFGDLLEFSSLLSLLGSLSHSHPLLFACSRPLCIASLSASLCSLPAPAQSTYALLSFLGSPSLSCLLFLSSLSSLLFLVAGVLP